MGVTTRKPRQPSRSHWLARRSRFSRSNSSDTALLGGGQAWPFAVVAVGLLDPITQRLGSDAELAGDSRDGAQTLATLAIASWTCAPRARASRAGSGAGRNSSILSWAPATMPSTGACTSGLVWRATCARSRRGRRRFPKGRSLQQSQGSSTTPLRRGAVPGDWFPTPRGARNNPARRIRCAWFRSAYRARMFSGATCRSFSPEISSVGTSS